MKIESLIGKGYFLPELPPPFNTEALSNYCIEILKEWDNYDKSHKASYSETKHAVFTIPKLGFARRQLSIPNPIHYLPLANVISENWDTIKNIYSQSDLSASKPVIAVNSKRSFNTLMGFGEFRKKCIIESFDKIFELKTDISKYYPSIYTHSIPWVLHTKKIAKERKKDFSLLGNQIDKYIQAGQSGQTAGIPIGPDTSLIISEILGCEFDHKLKSKFPNISGYRYVDDYYLYFNTQSDAETAFKYLQSLLTEYTLNANEEKTKIKKAPYEYQSEWVIHLGAYHFSDNEKEQSNDIYNFVSLVFKYSNLYPKDAVIKWAIKKLQRINIIKSNWELFESLVLKMCIAEPSILPDITRILVTYNSFISKKRLKTFLYTLLSIHIEKGHSFEVSWALWIARSFSIKIDKKKADKILQSHDYISILIALDMKNIGLISSDTTHLIMELELDAFKDERWLFAYESIYKKWLRPSNPSLVSKSKYFMALKKKGICFYDTTKQVSPIIRTKSKNPTKTNATVSFSKNLYIKPTIKIDPEDESTYY